MVHQILRALVQPLPQIGTLRACAAQPHAWDDMRLLQAPTWKQFAEAMQGESSTHIGEVDCTKETGLAKRFSIQGYPTILHISHVEGREVVRQYAGPRTVDGWVMARAAAPPALAHGSAQVQ